MTRTALLLMFHATLVLLVEGICTPLQPYNNTYIPLQNCLVYYQMTLGIGEPVQYSTFLVDTGSHTLWVPNSFCLCGNNYNESKSSTYVGNGEQGNVKYEDGTQVDGYYGTQKVRLNRTPITAHQCPMLFVTKQKAKGMGSDGIAGFGVSDVTFLDIAYDRQQIGSRVFILRLQHNDAPSGMYYNQLPSDILDRTRYVPLSHHQVWLIDCIGAMVGDQDYSSDAGTDMLVDSGTTLLIINQKLFDKIMAKSLAFCTYNTVIESWTCPKMFQLPIIRFLSRGVELQVHPDSYAITNGGMNVLQITSGERTILGMVFFKNYNVTFDKPRKLVGFDGAMTELTRIGSDFFFWSVVAVLSLLGACFLSMIVLRCVNNYKVKQR